MSQLPFACDIDRCFVVKRLILGHLAEITSANAAEKNVGPGPKLQNRLSVLTCPDSIFSCGGS